MLEALLLCGDQFQTIISEFTCDPQFPAAAPEMLEARRPVILTGNPE